MNKSLCADALATSQSSLFTCYTVHTHSGLSLPLVRSIGGNVEEFFGLLFVVAVRGYRGYNSVETSLSPGFLCCVPFLFALFLSIVEC